MSLHTIKKPEACIDQLRFNDKTVDLGLHEMSLEQAKAGSEPLLKALQAGLDIAAGLHQRISDIEEGAACAAKLGRLIHDVRHSDTRFTVGAGVRRPGRRLLTVALGQHS